MRQQQESARRGRRAWFSPGEIVAVAHVPREIAAPDEAIGHQVHRLLRDRASDHLSEDADETRTFRFDAPNEPRALIFSFHKLARADSPAAVKRAIEQLHRELSQMGGTDIEVVSVMPHIHVRAHDSSSGPSPGTVPRPVYPDQVPSGWRYRYYQPANPRLDLATRASSAEPVRVGVLDVQPELTEARKRGEHFREIAGNAQLIETVEWVQRHTPADGGYDRTFADLAPTTSAAPEAAGASIPDYAIPDHGLFIAGLIHGIAPAAPVSLVPVLDAMGDGDLAQLLLGVQRALRKSPDEPLILNLSLGFLPHPSRLPAAWYGLPREQDPEYWRADELFEPGRDEAWVAANRHEVDRTLELLQVGVGELVHYLRLNNTLVIAAAGNDSLAQVEAGRGRLEPRLPARFESVLGVAATASDPRRAARYSNLGDERELGDHVATFGGNVTDGLEPEDGVIGVYSGDFPFGRPNETGWAYWSGTSFATAIISGIAANFWSVHRELDAGGVLGALHAEARAFGPYVPALRTPAVEVLGRWGR